MHVYHITKGSREITTFYTRYHDNPRGVIYDLQHCHTRLHFKRWETRTPGELSLTVAMGALRVVKLKCFRPSFNSFHNCRRSLTAPRQTKVKQQTRVLVESACRRSLTTPKQAAEGQLTTHTYGFVRNCLSYTSHSAQADGKMSNYNARRISVQVSCRRSLTVQQVTKGQIATNVRLC